MKSPLNPQYFQAKAHKHLMRGRAGACPCGGVLYWATYHGQQFRRCKRCGRMGRLYP